MNRLGLTSRKVVAHITFLAKPPRRLPLLPIEPETRKGEFRWRAWGGWLLAGIMLALGVAGLWRQDRTVEALHGHGMVRSVGSMEATLGSIGRKHYVEGPNFFNRLLELPVAEEEKKIVARYTLDSDAALRLIFGPKALFDAKVQDQTRRTVTFRQLASPDSLVDELNRIASASPDRKWLLSHPYTRVVTGVAEVSDHADTVQGTVSGAASSASGTASGGGRRLAIHDGTVVAYQVAKVCWMDGRIVTLQRDIEGQRHDHCITQPPKERNRLLAWWKSLTD